MADDLKDSSGNPFFTEVVDIAEQLSVGMLGGAPAVLLRNETGGHFARLSAPEAKALYEHIKRLAQ